MPPIFFDLQRKEKNDKQTIMWVVIWATELQIKVCRSKFTRSKWDWTRIWTFHLECSWNQPKARLWCPGFTLILPMKKQYHTSEYILIPDYVQEEAAVWDSTIGCKHSSNLKIGSACKRSKTNRGKVWANHQI